MMPVEEKISYIDSRLSSMDSDPNASFDEILTLKSQRNALQQINEVPMEVLLHIFMSRIPALPVIRPYDLETSHYYRICLDITHVCRHWRNIALGCPKIWSKFVNMDNTNVDVIRLFLERSSMADIEVALGEPGKPVHSDTLKLLRGHMHRVSFLVIYMAGDSELTQELLMQCGPRLKYLHLYNLDRESRRVDVLSHIPLSIQLLELVIDWIYLPWNSSILQGLSSLIVSYRGGTLQLTLFNLLDVLEACPLLRNIHFMNVEIGTTENPQKRSIKLPYLESVCLQNIDFKAYQIFSDCVIIPKDVEWTVTCINIPIEQPKLSISTLPERTEQCKTIGITLTETFIEFAASGFLIPYTLLCYNWNRIAAPQLISDLLISLTKMLVAQPFWNNPVAVKIESMLDYDVANEAFWSTILTLLPHIRSLRITAVLSLNHLSFLKGIIGALTEPTDHNPQSTVWLCPDLEKLELHNFKFSSEAQQHYKKLVDHLQLRRDCGRGLHELKFTKCSGIRKKDIYKLRRFKVASEVIAQGNGFEGWDYINVERSI